MGDQLVVYSNVQGALAIRKADPEKEAADREKRIKDALELEAKLKMINETVPTRVYNTSSSSAGAGSGDFHQYRMVRRAEQNRVKRIEEDWKKKEAVEEFEAKKREREQHAEESAARRRKKRLKKKQKSVAKQGAGADAALQQGAAAEGDAKKDESSEDDEPVLD